MPRIKEIDNMVRDKYWYILQVLNNNGALGIFPLKKCKPSITAKIPFGASEISIKPVFVFAFKKRRYVDRGIGFRAAFCC